MLALPLLCALLIGLNALFVLVEYALVRTRPARIELLARKGDTRALRVQEMLARLDTYLAAIQVGVTLVALALGAFAETPITEYIRRRTEGLIGDLPDRPLRLFSQAVTLGLLTFLQIVLGELLPRGAALQKAEAIALWGSFPLKLWAMLCRLPVVLMASSSAALGRLLGIKRGGEAEAAVSEDEIRILLGQTQEKGALPLERLFLAENLFDLGNTKAGEAMVPWSKAATLSLERPWAENFALIQARRFSRYPLCQGGPDSVVGFLHVKDLLLRASSGPEPDLASLRRDITKVPDSEPLERLLKTFPDKGIHIAAVTGADGQVAGLITLEDIVEELIGEVHDEFDYLQAWSLSEAVVPSAVLVGAQASDRASALSQLIAALASSVEGLNAAEVFKAVWEREEKFSSAVGHGLALPHARLAHLDRALVAVGRFAKPIPYPAPDNVGVKLVFLILTPAQSPLFQLKILSRIASLAVNENLRQRLMRAKTSAAMLHTLRTADTLLAS